MFDDQSRIWNLVSLSLATQSVLELQNLRVISKPAIIDLQAGLLDLLGRLIL
jgi:hypothetical protein